MSKSVVVVFMKNAGTGAMTEKLLSEHENINEAMCSMHTHVSAYRKYFEKLGYNPRNTNFRIASYYKHNEFCELMVLEKARYNMMKNCHENIVKEIVPRDFTEAAARMTRRELTVFYGTTKRVISMWEATTRQTALPETRSPSSGRKKKTIPDDLEEMAVRFTSRRDLAKHYNVSSTTVYNWLHERDIPIRAIRPTYCIPDDFSEMRRYMSRGDLADIYDVSGKTIDEWSYDLDAGKIRSSAGQSGYTIQNHRRNEIPSDLKNVADKALTLKEVADHYGTNSTTVKSWLREVGIGEVRTRDSRKIKRPDDILKINSMSAKDLAKEYSVSRSTAYRWKRDVSMK